MTCIDAQAADTHKRLLAILAYYALGCFVTFRLRFSFASSVLGIAELTLSSYHDNAREKSHRSLF